MKMLGIAAVAAGALMAFVGAGTASAGGVLCSTTVSPCPTAQKWSAGTVLDFSLKPETSAKIVNAAKPTETLDTCTGSGTTLKGTLTANPDANGEATGENTSIVWEHCTFPTTALSLGKFRINNIAATSNGTNRADGDIQLLTIQSVLFGSCSYGVKSGTDLGTTTEGNPAHYDAQEVPLVRLAGSSTACPENAIWTAEYVLTSPTNTTLSVSSS